MRPATGVMFGGREPTALGRDFSAEKEPSMHDIPAQDYRASAVKHQPRSNRHYFDVGIGSVCLSGDDTGGAYCLLEVGLAPGMSVPRHTHTREDEAYCVLLGELEVTAGDKVFMLRPGDSLMAPREIPISYAIPATSRTTISWCSRRRGSRNF